MPKLILPIIFIISVLFLIYLVKIKTVTTIKFFPFDEEVTIENASTNITLNGGSDIIWTIKSNSSEPSFLRQDVSLLYENGKFKGVHSQWKQNIAELEASYRFPSTYSAKIEAISFHHAELHRYQDQITSAQKMTYEQAYLVKENETYNLFKEPENKKETTWKEKLDQMTERQLKFHWNQLMNYFQIDKDQYILIPLTDLSLYENNPFPNLNQTETNEVIGKLWEGLYKNYILRLRESENQYKEHYEPLVLVAKDGTHLLVLFELNGEKQQLIQRIPQAND